MTPCLSSGTRYQQRQFELSSTHIQMVSGLWTSLQITNTLPLLELTLHRPSHFGTGLTRSKMALFAVLSSSILMSSRTNSGSSSTQTTHMSSAVTVLRECCSSTGLQASPSSITTLHQEIRRTLRLQTESVATTQRQSSCPALKLLLQELLVVIC